MKLGIIDVGKVGSQILTDVQSTNLFSSIVVIDSNETLAYGEVLDHHHTQGLKTTNHIEIIQGTYDDLKDADVVVVTASVPMDPEISDRTALTKGNISLIEDIMNQINAVTQQPLVIFISNPVDAMTYIATQANDYPNEKIMGTGTLLESARFRTLIADHYDIDPKSVEAFVIGEHGKNAVPVWSKVTISGMSLTEFETLSQKPAINKEAITQKVDKVAFDVLKNKGWTNAAISKTTVDLIKRLMLNEKSILPLTSLNEEKALAIGLPTLTNRSGVAHVFDIELDADERAHFEQAEKYIKATIDVKNQ
ncbi:lactate dehydrogenase [Staphylococcus chromogenes]|uniref:lactate/malate family dehydrogenase n=1 Tax=Staphylococcus chromogenes TaxID=46126 RepID=UPI001F37FACE|nr:lactate dehydrogenase [Staphylococcus chromogenes]MCE4970811.1 lactate dehydrogenase [Staphylococcus chromogenes]